MDCQVRAIRYKAIERYRKTPLIVYATSTRDGVGAVMASDAVRQLIDQLDAITDSDSVDVLIHSSGGDPLAAWKLMSILRERFKKVSVLVPYMAFSAATIFALGADEIVMHPHASLGPIDPQITVTLPDGSRRAFSYEDVGAFLRFLDDEVGITEQVHATPLIDKLFSAVDPLVVGAAKRASELSTTVGERLLRMHLAGPTAKDTARQIAENLNKSFFAHGDAVSRTRARELNLQIGKDDSELEQLLWNAFLGLEDYMELRKAFNPVFQFQADPAGRDALAPSPVLSLPPDAPGQVVEAVWNAAANAALSRLSQKGVQVEYSIINAVIESTRVASEHYTRGRISATRAVGGDVQVSMLPIEGGWRDCSLQSEKEKTS